MTVKSTVEALSERVHELEIELMNLRAVTARIHTSRIYQTEKNRLNHDPILNFIGDGITVLDQSGIILYLNQAAEQQLGYQSAELTGKNISEFIVSVGADTEFLQSITDSFKDHCPKPSEYIITFANDKKAMMHLNFILREEPVSGTRHLWIIHRDITKEKRLEEELKCSQERLKNLIDSFPDIILNVDLSGRILFINPGSKAKFSEKIVGTEIYDYVLPEDHEKIRCEVKRVFETGEMGGFESSGIGFDGIVRWYTTRVIPIKHDNQVIAVTLNARDNSEKKETEEELRNSQKLLDSVLQSIPGILVVLDKKLNIMASNWHGIKKFKPSNPNEKSKCYQLYWHRDSPCEECHARKVFLSGKPVTVEMFNKKDKGYKEIRAYPVLNDVGTIKYVIEHIQDITLRKKNEEKLVLAKLKTEAAQQLKIDFLSKINHELKTPMIGILGFSKLGIERHKTVTKEKLKNYFSTILESGEKLQTLLNDLVDISQLEVGHMEYDFQKEPLSMVTTIILNEMFTLLKECRITVDYKKPEFCDQVTVDVDRIGKVIRNLVTNAIKFSKPESTITIRISETKKAIQFSVTDTGEKIPEAELNQIFEKFSQNNRTQCNSGGRELGLAISKKIIADHKGQIWVENNSSEGTVFKFTLPRNKEIT